MAPRRHLLRCSDGAISGPDWMDVLPLEGGLRKVVIRQLKLLGIVGFPLPKYKAQNISAIAFSVISVRGDSASNSFFEQRLAGVLCVSKYITDLYNLANAEGISLRRISRGCQVGNKFIYSKCAAIQRKSTLTLGDKFLQASLYS